LKGWSFHKIPFSKGMTGEYRISVRKGTETFLISNPTASKITLERFKELETFLKEWQQDNPPILITFIKRYGKKWITDLDLVN